MRNIYEAEITDIDFLADNIVSIIFLCPDIARVCSPGQFIHVKCGDSLLLRRPFGICDVVCDKVRFVFEVVGDGTTWLSKQKRGSLLNILGPLGNCFDFPENRNDEKIVFVGGGLGVPPLLFAARQTSSHRSVAILGFRDKSKVILQDEFLSLCDDTVVTTDDGSYGAGCNVISPLKNFIGSEKIAAVYSCGPHIMLKEVAKTCCETGVRCMVLLEERMGCGVGACLVCACRTIAPNGSFETQMKSVCRDGPVFDAEVVLW